MIRFIQIGDVHLRSGHPRNATRLTAFDQIVAETLVLDHLGAVLIPGDLFDTRDTITDRNDLAQRLTALIAVAPIVMVPGNHDLPGSLDIFARLKGRWPIYLATVPGVLTVPLATGNTAAIACLPYPTKAGLVAQGVTPDAIVQTAADALEYIFMKLAADLGVAIALGHLPLFIGHVNVGGSVSSVGQPMIGKEIELAPGHLDRLGDIPKLLSHIHNPQDIAGAHYAGSIAPNDYGEIEAKSYLQVDYAGLGAFTILRRPLHVPPLYHVEGELTRQGFSWQVTKGPGGAPIMPPTINNTLTFQGAEVRVRYTFKQSEKAVLDHAMVRAPFSKALRLDCEPIAVPDRALRAPEVATAMTLRAKVEAWAKVSAVTVTADVLDKLAALETMDGAVLLAGVQTLIANLEAEETEVPV